MEQQMQMHPYSPAAALAMRDELQGIANLIKARQPAQRPVRPARPCVAAAPAPTLEAYRAALVAHDWSFERSDDHSVWCKGRDSLGAIRSMQHAIDPAYAVWNEHAPIEHQVQQVVA